MAVLDAAERADHVFVATADQCTYLGHYRSGEGFGAGRCNQLMRNFKCEPSIARSDPRRARFKRQAIATLAQWLRSAVTREQAESCTWIPIPPSKQRTDPDFDDRLVRTLRVAFDRYDVDIRSALYQVQSTGCDHGARARLSADALFHLLRLDSALLSQQPLRQRIALFDDLLTSGKHFKCCERRLREAVAGVPIAGVFLMRRALPRRQRSLGCDR